MDHLCSIALLERDQYGDVLLTYVYPSLPEGVTPSLLERKSGLVPSATSGPDAVIPTQFMYTRFRENWIYVQTTSGSFAGLPLVRALSVVLVAKVFNPEKYEALLKLLTGTYTATGETGKVLKAYLAVLIKESYNFAGQGAFELAKFDDRRALLQGPFKELVATFGMETVLIVTAVLLKKRVIVYSARQDVLLQYLRIMPMFAAHRQNWGILRPIVHFTDDEIAELDAAAVYVAGTTDETADSHEDLYDLFVDIDDRSVTVASGAKNDFMMGKPHKDLAQFLVAASDEADKTDAQVAKLLAQRVQGLLQQLQTLIPEGKHAMSVADIKAKEMPAALQRFMWNLAVAENLAEL